MIEISRSMCSNNEIEIVHFKFNEEYYLAHMFWKMGRGSVFFYRADQTGEKHSSGTVNDIWTIEAEKYLFDLN